MTDDKAAEQESAQAFYSILLIAVLFIWMAVFIWMIYGLPSMPILVGLAFTWLVLLFFAASKEGW